MEEFVSRHSFSPYSVVAFLLSDSVCPAPCRVLKVRFKATGSAPKSACAGKQFFPRGALWLRLRSSGVGKEGLLEEGPSDLKGRAMLNLSGRRDVLTEACISCIYSGGDSLLATTPPRMNYHSVWKKITQQGSHY